MMNLFCLISGLEHCSALHDVEKHGTPESGTVLVECSQNDHRLNFGASRQLCFLYAIDFTSGYVHVPRREGVSSDTAAPLMLCW